MGKDYFIWFFIGFESKNNNYVKSPAIGNIFAAKQIEGIEG